MFQKQILFGLFLFCSVALFAQPSNDNCSNPIVIPNPTSYCSNFGQYTNVAATPSNFTAGTSCFVGNGKDVWFRFVAVGQDLNVTVIGNESTGPGGTLQRPEVELLITSNCSNFGILGCATAPSGTNIIELNRSGLQVGQTYYLRVDGANNNTGTFKLCVRNFTAPSQPGSDCVLGAVLCTQDPFSVQSVTGVGNNPNEAAGTCLDTGGGLNSENASTWYRWTCEVSGTLNFVITPHQTTDDIDFVLYELPGGLNDCSNKQPLRCMATHCPDGPTGLNSSSTDVNEQAGCPFGNDGFLATLNLVAGRSYALLINNFTSAGNGFELAFGASNTSVFQGPDANFNLSDNKICEGSNVTFTDASFFQNGSITGWEWDFGVGASPQTASVRGPHQVTYTSGGTKYVTLQVTTSSGCEESITKQLEVVADTFSFTPTVTDPPCFGENGSIVIDNHLTTPTQIYAWSNGANTSSISVTGGNYTLTISNGACDTTTNFTLTDPITYDFSFSIDTPTCNGGMDGAVLVDITNVNPPFQYAWSNGATTQDLNNIPIGNYTLTITDGTGCVRTFPFLVKELELEIDSLTSIIRDPSCYGYSDGRISLEIGNGLPPFSFDWGNTGTPVLWDSVRNNLPQGIYPMTVYDANLCRGVFQFQLEHPDTLIISALDSVDIRCFGENNGQAIPLVEGGTYPYFYTWSAGNPTTDSVATNLPPGIVYLTVTDNHGCTATDDALILEPTLLKIDDWTVHDALCFGVNNGSIEMTASGGTPVYEYGVDLTQMQPDTLIDALYAGNYTIYVRDSRGCIDSVEDVLLTQPFELIVDAGPDRVIRLGDSTELAALVNSDWVNAYSWQPPYYITCDTCKYTYVRPPFSTEYFITVTDIYGCTDSDSVNITVNPYYPIYIPNAFTPNGDGENDTFYPFGSIALSRVLKMQIFDRWGEKIYEASDFPPNTPSYGWDGTYKGKVMNPNVFVYAIEVAFYDGSKRAFHGDVTLIR